MSSEQLKKIFEKGGTKKVSLNVNKEVLGIVDEMAKIFEMNRSETIFVLIKLGIKEQIETAEKLWNKWIKEGKYKKSQEIIVKKLRDSKFPQEIRLV